MWHLGGSGSHCRFGGLTSQVVASPVMASCCRAQAVDGGPSCRLAASGVQARSRSGGSAVQAP